MFVKIFGSFCVLLGIFFFIRPQVLKRRLQKKVFKRAKKIIFAFVFALGVGFICVAWKYKGIIPRIFTILGCVGIFKAFFFLKAKAAEEVIVWFGRQSVSFFRICALGYVGLGLLIFFGLR